MNPYRMIIKTKTIMVWPVHCIADLELVAKDLPSGSLLRWTPELPVGPVLNAPTQLTQLPNPVPAITQTPTPMPAPIQQEIPVPIYVQKKSFWQNLKDRGAARQQQKLEAKIGSQKESRFQRLQVHGLKCYRCQMPNSEWGDQVEGKTICSRCKYEFETKKAVIV